MAGVVNRGDFEARAFFFCQHLPRNDVGVVLEPGDDDLVVLLNVLAAPALRDEIDAFGGAAHENDFSRVRGVQEAADFGARALVGVCGAGGQFVSGAMDVGIFVRVKIVQAINHGLRLLRGGGVIEPDELPAVDALVQDWEVALDLSDFKWARR